MRGQETELLAYRWHAGRSDRFAYAMRDGTKEPQLHRQTDLRLIVLVGVRRRVMELGAAHVGVAVDENTLPRHLYVLEIDERIVFVETRRQGIVEQGYRRRFVGLTRQNTKAFDVHWQRAGEGQRLLARLEGLQVGYQNLVGHNRTGAQQLGAANRNACGVLIDDASDEIFRLVTPVLGAFRLRVDDDVGEIIVIATGFLE